MSGALLKFGSFKSKRSFLVLFFYIYIHTDDVLLLTFNYILKNICLYLILHYDTCTVLRMNMIHFHWLQMNCHFLVTSCEQW